jgi:hypothetical protein
MPHPALLFDFVHPHGILGELQVMKPLVCSFLWYLVTSPFQTRIFSSASCNLLLHKVNIDVTTFRRLNAPIRMTCHSSDDRWRRALNISSAGWTVTPGLDQAQRTKFRWAESLRLSHYPQHELSLWRMPSSGLWRRVDLVWTEVSEERIASVFRVEKSSSKEPAWAGGSRLSYQSCVLYGCETWSLILREKHRLRLLENRVLRKLPVPKRIT